MPTVWKYSSLCPSTHRDHLYWNTVSKTAEKTLTRPSRYRQQIASEARGLIRCVNKQSECVWHPAMTLIHPRCFDPTAPRPPLVLCQKTTCWHIAACLLETLIQASHTPLHSVLSSVSLPHYSSSIFKREYALLQLVCLEANLSCSLQWAASPSVHIFSFLSLFHLSGSFRPFHLCCAFWLILALEDMEGRGQEGGTLHMYLYYVTQAAGWNTERHLEGVELGNEAKEESAKQEADKKVEESNLLFFHDVNDQGGIWGNSNCLC